MLCWNIIDIVLKCLHVFKSKRIRSDHSAAIKFGVTQNISITCKRGQKSKSKTKTEENVLMLPTHVDDMNNKKKRKNKNKNPQKWK
jgi:hypothetical protein